MRGNIGGMMAQAQRMQQNMKRIQDQLAQTEVEGTAGGGAVKVVMTCKYVCKSVTIDPKLFEEDSDMIEDLVLTAINEAGKAVEAKTSQSMNAFRASLGLPPGMLPF